MRRHSSHQTGTTTFSFAILLFAFCASKLLAHSRSYEQQSQPQSAPQDAPIVTITLQEYWHETITREEGLRRLSGRALDPQRRARIEKGIPPRTEHYLSFEGNVFREFIQFGDGVAYPLLQLPLDHVGDSFDVIVPIHDSERYHDGRTRRLSGIEIHEFRTGGGKLVENDRVKESFQFSREPVSLRLDLSYALMRRPILRDCCDWCEWVHSIFDIHCADWLCCLGTC